MKPCLRNACYRFKRNDDLKSAEEKLINLSRDNLNIFLDNLEEGKAKHLHKIIKRLRLPQNSKGLLQQTGPRKCRNHCEEN